MMNQTTIDGKSVIADLVLKRAGCPASHRQKLKSCIKQSIKTHYERLVEMLSSQLKVHITTENIEANISHMDDFLTTCFRQRNIELSSPESQEEDQDGHIEAIKKHSAVLTKDLRIQGTLLLDKLVENEVLSEAGQQSIIQRGNNHSVNSAFLKFCNGLSLSRFNKTILPALENSSDSTNAHLAKTLKKSISGMSKKSNRSQCVSCKIQNVVNYRRLADQLYMMKAISDNFREDLSSQSISNGTKWKRLLQMNNLKALVFALKKKYPDLYKLMQQTPQNIRNCMCWVDTGDDKDIEMDVTSDVTSDVARMSTISSMTDSSSCSISDKVRRNSIPKSSLFSFEPNPSPRDMII